MKTLSLRPEAKKNVKKNIFFTMLLMIAICLGSSTAASATDVVISSITTFAAADASDGTSDGVFNVTGNLIITSSGAITGDVNGANFKGAFIQINVTGNLLIMSGGRISSVQTGGSCTVSGGGGNIRIITGGDFVMQTSSVVASNGVCPAGEIYIRSSGLVLIDGLVEAKSSLSGTGAVQRPGGGAITIIGDCSLQIHDNGKVSSQGQDPGADLVHLEACTVNIYGLVQSTGVGHASPNNPVNHLVPPNRPGKPANSTAGVEIWANTITIDRVSHNGQVHADLSIGAEKVAWIDLYATGLINILGSNLGAFAVHANNGGNNNRGGFITVRSIDQSVSATGRALQSNGAFGGSGGTILVESKNDLNLNGSVFMEANGVSRTGGTISLRSFNGDINSSATASLSVAGPTIGSVARTACGAIGVATITPATVVPVDNSGAGFCGGNPALYQMVVFPDCSAGSCESGSPQPCEIITADNKTSICEGSSIELCAPEGYSYTWNTGATTRCITVSSANTYTVVITDANGGSAFCSKVIQVNLPQPCTITGNGYFCPGGSTELCAPEGLTYLWSTGATSRCVTVNSAATYSVTTTDGNGCSSTCEKVVVQSPNLTVTCTANNFARTLTANPSGGTGPYTYAWNTVPAQFTRTVTVDTEDSYTVVVTDARGCTASTSCFVNLCNGFRSQTQGGWGATPQGNNPAKYMTQKFSTAFPASDYLTIGCATGNRLRLTTAKAVTDFLPSGSTPTALPVGLLINPGQGYSNVFAGQLVALTLSIRFDLTDPNFSPAAGHLQDLIVNSGPFAGWTVAQVVGEANKKIGGCESNYAYSDLNNVLDAINNNYDNANVNSGFLSCPGTFNFARGIVTKPALNDKESEAKVVKSSVYPNPFTSNTTIEFLAQENSAVATIEVYNPTGRKIAVLFVRDVKAGKQYKSTFSGREIAAGMYTYKIINGSKIINGKLVKIN